MLLQVGLPVEFSGGIPSKCGDIFCSSPSQVNSIPWASQRCNCSWIYYLQCNPELFQFCFTIYCDWSTVFLKPLLTNVMPIFNRLRLARSRFNWLLIPLQSNCAFYKAYRGFRVIKQLARWAIPSISLVHRSTIPRPFQFRASTLQITESVTRFILDWTDHEQLPPYFIFLSHSVLIEIVTCM